MSCFCWAVNLLFWTNQQWWIEENEKLLESKLSGTRLVGHFHRRERDESNHVLPMPTSHSVDSWKNLDHFYKMPSARRLNLLNFYLTWSAYITQHWEHPKGPNRQPAISLHWFKNANLLEQLIFEFCYQTPKVFKWERVDKSYVEWRH